MSAQKIQRYDHPEHFMPLVPGEPALESLLEHASDLSRAAQGLGSRTPPSVHRELREMLRRMNSYYTNRLEGEHTRPSDIDAALHKDFSDNLDLARKQRLAVAHIRAEQHCEAELDAQETHAGEAAWRSLYSPGAVMWLHRVLFALLGPEDRRLSDGRVMEAGNLRKTQVSVGKHEAPAWEAVPAFLERWGAVYGKVRRGEASIVAACASHHRLAWVHPMEDGNGRVARLHTHLLFYGMGLSSGLWSPLRGFARSEERYRSLLQAADEHRQGDLDGRGNLTQKGLVNWIDYVLDVCIDQVKFMTHQLDAADMRHRMELSIVSDKVSDKHLRPEVVPALHYLFTSGEEIPRADFKLMTGLGERTATSTLSALLNYGYLRTESKHGHVRFGIPQHALRFYFPKLWPEAEQDEIQVRSGTANVDYLEVDEASRGKNVDYVDTDHLKSGQH